MRIVFFNYGTRGDTQPPVALATVLKQRGYEVRVAAPENLRGFVESAGIEYAELHGSSQAILESEMSQMRLASGNKLAFLQTVIDISQRVSPGLYVSALQAVEGADAIVGGTLIEDLSYTLAEHRRLPFLLTYTIPYEPTGAFPAPLLTTAAWPFAPLNRWSYALFRRLAWRMNRDVLNPFRESLGLAPMPTTIVSGAHGHDIPVVQMWSPEVIAHSADYPPNVRTTGFVRVPQAMRARLGEAAPPAALVDWLNAPALAAPIYMGFGSMPVLDPERMMRTVVAVAGELKIRVIVSAGWAGLDAVRHLAGDNVFFVGAIDHGWLLPQCAAAVHHGGAGTTAAALEAGIPALVCSVFGDQPFWAERLRRLSVGEHVPFAKLNEANLAAGLRAILRDDVRARARALGERLRAEDGTTAAADAIAAHLGPPG